MAEKKILVIEDEDLVRDALVNALKKEGYKLVMASNAIEALERVKSEELDLILSDIKMPGMDGVQAAKEIIHLFAKNGKRDIPIVFITGYSLTVKELQAENIGEVILKPLDLDTLLITLRQYL